MTEFQFHVEGGEGPATVDVALLEGPAEAQREAAHLFAQLIKDDAPRLWDAPALRLTVTETDGSRSFVLELSARTDIPAPQR